MYNLNRLKRNNSKLWGHYTTVTQFSRRNSTQLPRKSKCGESNANEFFRTYTSYGYQNVTLLHGFSCRFGHMQKIILKNIHHKEVEPQQLQPIITKQRKALYPMGNWNIKKFDNYLGAKVWCKEEAMFQGARDCCQTNHILQAPVMVINDLFSYDQNQAHLWHMSRFKK